MEQQTKKLLNVLRRIARAAGYTAWVKTDPEAARFCATQYNKVLNRLAELEPAVNTVFSPLAADVSPGVTRIAARDLLAYFEADTVGVIAAAFERPFAYGCRPRRMRGRPHSLAIHCE